MIATMTRISCVAQDVDDASSHGQVTHFAAESVACQRCGGLLVDEYCMDIGEGGGGNRSWAMRCIQCGDIIDQTILLNRQALRHTLQQFGQAA
ncbi:MAG: hypothetical protein ABI980_16140 [Nitrospirota bacterium]